MLCILILPVQSERFDVSWNDNIVDFVVVNSLCVTPLPLPVLLHLLYSCSQGPCEGVCMLIVPLSAGHISLNF